MTLEPPGPYPQINPKNFEIYRVTYSNPGEGIIVTLDPLVPTQILLLSCGLLFLAA